MKLLLLLVLTLILIVQPSMAQSDDDIKQKIIDQSILSYSGSCPCPYNRDRAGRRCGKRSAYSRPGGVSPICFPEDVTPKMVREHKK
jgi:hypothetical protein